MTAYERYRKKALVPFQLMLNRNTDRDILEWMEKQPSKAGAVKAAIRAAMLSAPAPAPESAPALEPAPESAPAPVPEPAPEIWWYDGADDVPILAEYQKVYRIDWTEKRGGVRECFCYAVCNRYLMTAKKVKAAFLARRPKNAPHAFHLVVTGSR